MATPTDKKVVDFLMEDFIKDMNEIKLPGSFFRLFQPKHILNPKWKWWKFWVQKMIPEADSVSSSEGIPIDIVRGKNGKI